MTRKKTSKSGGQHSADHEIRKVSRDEGLILKVFGGQDDAGDGTGTKQLPKDHFEKDIKAGNVISPLYDPLIWAFLLEQNTRLNTLVRKMAENTVGLGWELIPLKQDDEMWIEQNREAINEEREAISPLFEHPNDEMAFSQLMMQVKMDEEATGQGWIEVVRSVDGSEVKKLFHIPSYTMRVAKGGDRYVQMRPSDTTKKVYFKNFGDTRMLGASTGEWSKPGEPVNPDDQANEVLQFKLYTPRSSFYGVPRVVSAAPAVAGTRLAHRRNVSFFENDAPMACFTPILTPVGWTTMGELEVGQEVIGSDGKTKKILDVIPQGIKPVYRLIFKDGATTNSTAGHIWTVTNSYDRKRGVTRDLMLREIIESGTHYDSGDAKWSIPLVDPVEFAPLDKPLPLHPYLMGYYIGNGWASGSHVAICCNRQDGDELQDILGEMIPNNIRLSRRDRVIQDDYDGTTTIGFCGGKNDESVLNKVRDLGLHGCGAEGKFIPKQYLRASISERIELLRGLLDSDGHISDTAIRYVTISKELAENVAELVGSLGGVVTIRKQKGRSTLQLTISKLPFDIKPYRLSRKGSAWHISNAARWRTIERIEYWQDTDTRCIRVDTEDNLYVAENFIVTHNTPRLAIIVNGGELSDESMEMIEDFIDTRGKGPGNAGRIMVLQARGADHMLGGGENLKINVMPLTVGVQDDASFNRYTMANNEEVRECFGIGQIFIGTSDDVNRAVALAMKQLTVEQVFVPEAKRYEYRLNNTIVRTFAVEHIKLQFTRPRTTDTLMEAQAFSMLSAVGGVTPNDVRDFLNKPRFEGKWANTPMAILKQGLLQDVGDELATIWTAYGDKMPPMNLVNAQALAAGAKAEMDATEGGQQLAAAKTFDNIDASDLEDVMEEVQLLAQGLRKLGFNVTIEPLNAE